MTTANASDLIPSSTQDTAQDTSAKAPKTRKGGALSATQAAHDSALATSTSSAADGKQQAMTDAQSFALAYAKTTAAVTPIVAQHIQAARGQMSAAISSVSAESVVGDVDNDDFLSEFDLGLSLLLGQ